MSQILRANDVQRATGLSKSQRYRLIAAGKFPKQIKIGSRASGWLLEEIEQWIQARAAERQPVRTTKQVAT